MFIHTFRFIREKNIKKVLEKITKDNFKKLFLFIYIFGLIFGVILFFIGIFIPSLITCSSIFRREFCTNTGMFLILFLSLPGYLIAGNLFKFLNTLPWVLSLTIVIITSGLFYFFIGFIVDKKGGRRFDAISLSKLIIYSSLLVLILLLVSLV